MDTEELARLAVEADLDDVAEELAALARWAIRLEGGPSGPAAGNPRSRLGGLPDLPPGTPWPCAEPPFPEAGLPMVFVAQVALEDLRPFPQWPAQSGGLLSFFLAGESDILFVEEAGAAHVRHTPAGEELARIPPAVDLPAECVLGEVPLVPRDELTLPEFTYSPARALVPLGFEPYKFELEGPQARRRHRYHELLRRLAEAQDAEEPRHRLLGHPAPVHNDVLEDLASLVARGRDEDLSDDVEGRATEASRWRLLFQVDQDHRLGVSWGNSGSAYFCLPEDDLAAGRYDRAEVVTQST